ncbi:ribonuclease H-like YkuK family protein [Patescibacteria group bacterium]|nr:ribonuclease H-like YkuK family protein [Patescibacteria group bacterium]MBU1868403.1 ribonuclease H-like YkuK family protein [Patescibacteria group bacterium]
MLNFNSPTYGKLSLGQMMERILNYIRSKPEYSYRLVIGTDSQPKNSKRFDFVTAFVVHRVGAGGIYFWYRLVEERKYHLRARIYREAMLSLQLAQKLVSFFPDTELSGYSLEIHVDIGTKGETRAMISEVVGMVRGMGFEVRTKPEAFGATSVADRYA